MCKIQPPCLAQLSGGAEWKLEPDHHTPHWWTKAELTKQGLWGLGEEAVKKCAGLTLESGKLCVQTIVSTAACCHAALWLRLAIREMTPNKCSVWAHLPESWRSRVPSVEDGHRIARWPSTLLFCSEKHWNFGIVQSLGYSERFWWISNITMHPSFISVAVYNPAGNSLGKKGFLWFTVPHCSPSLRVKSRQEFKSIVISYSQTKA